MKYENRPISAEVELKIDLTKLTQSAGWVRQPGSMEKGNDGQTSFQRGTGERLHRSQSLQIYLSQSATLHKPLKTFCEMLCTLALKDLITPPVPDELASESHSPCERDFQQQLLPKEGVEEGSGKSCL